MILSSLLTFIGLWFLQIDGLLGLLFDFNPSMIDRKARVAANLVTGWVSNGEKWFLFLPTLRQILKDFQVFLIWKVWLMNTHGIDSWRGCISLLAVMLSLSLLLKDDWRVYGCLVAWQPSKMIKTIVAHCVKSHIFAQKFGILTKSGKSSNLNFGAKIQ